MHSSLQKLKFIKNQVIEIANKKQLKTNPKIIVVSKTFPLNDIIPLLEYGHIHYGENKIQETENKWSEVKNNYKHLQLHMLGKVQSNKAKIAVKLFDYIHSLDSEKLALKISQHQKDLGKQLKFFIQVNIGDENQKSGVNLNTLSNFYNFCVKELSLNVIGLMCLPPINDNPIKFFNLLKESSKKLNLNELSMGMSSDFESAVLSGATYLRLGTVIMGKRNII